jgi:hypothetical protein
MKIRSGQRGLELERLATPPKRVGSMLRLSTMGLNRSDGPHRFPPEREPARSIGDSRTGNRSKRFITPKGKSTFQAFACSPGGSRTERLAEVFPVRWRRKEPGCFRRNGSVPSSTGTAHRCPYPSPDLRREGGGAIPPVYGGHPKLRSSHGAEEVIDPAPTYDRSHKRLPALQLLRFRGPTPTR